MSLKINWTSESRRTFNQNLEYLTKEWNNVVMNSFLDRVEEALENIKSNPRLYPLHNQTENVHKCVIHEALFYFTGW